MTSQAPFVVGMSSTHLLEPWGTSEGKYRVLQRSGQSLFTLRSAEFASKVARVAEILVWTVNYSAVVKYTHTHTHTHTRTYVRTYVRTSVRPSIHPSIQFVDPEPVTAQLDMKQVILKSQYTLHKKASQLQCTQQSTTTEEYFCILTAIIKQFT
jgi:hypothetical protein